MQRSYSVVTANEEQFIFPSALDIEEGADVAIIEFANVDGDLEFIPLTVDELREIGKQFIQLGDDLEEKLNAEDDDEEP